MRTRWIQLAATLLALALLGVAGRFVAPINAGRAELNMMGSRTPQENVPPEYAFAIQAFGAFRGLITNIAFIRAEKYKEQGRYYDAYQLASWICKLQPRFPAVWEFQSWNMAWNISVTTYTPEERWHWVYNGVKLIRDEGLKWNPRAVNLYKQLAWIFINKMGEMIDDFNMYYKRQWAWRMHLVLGPPPDPLGTRAEKIQFKPLELEPGKDTLADALLAEAERKLKEHDAEEKIDDLIREIHQTEQRATLPPPKQFLIATNACYRWIKRIADAPESLRELYEKHPETRRMVRELRKLGIFIRDETLNEDTYWNEKGLAFTFFYPYRMLKDPPSFLSQILKSPDSDLDPETLRRLDEILGVSRDDPDGQALVRFLQKKILREVYKLDPQHMAELTARFGPIDWRGVDAQGLYWVNEGLIAGKESIHSFYSDKINTARMIFFALRNMFNRNRIVFEPYTKNANLAYINFSPDLNFIEPMHRAFLTYGKMLDPGGTLFRTGHVNFLAEAIRLLYFAGRKDEARYYYEILRDLYGAQPDGSPNPRYAKSLDRFVMDTFRENLDTYRDARLALNGVIFTAVGALASGDLPRYNELMTFAYRLHHDYNQRRKNSPKMLLPDFKSVVADVLLQWFRTPATSPTTTVIKARLWTRYLPTDLKLPIYDELKDLFAAECEKAGFELAKAFPPPEGIEQWRKQHPRRGPKQKKSRVETPAQQLQ